MAWGPSGIAARQAAARAGRSALPEESTGELSGFPQLGGGRRAGPPAAAQVKEALKSGQDKAASSPDAKPAPVEPPAASSPATQAEVEVEASQIEAAPAVSSTATQEDTTKLLLARLDPLGGAQAFLNVTDGLDLVQLLGWLHAVRGATPEDLDIPAWKELSIWVQGFGGPRAVLDLLKIDKVQQSVKESLAAAASKGQAQAATSHHDVEVVAPTGTSEEGDSGAAAGGTDLPSPPLPASPSPAEAPAAPWNAAPAGPPPASPPPEVPAPAATAAPSTSVSSRASSWAARVTGSKMPQVAPIKAPAWGGKGSAGKGTPSSQLPPPSMPAPRPPGEPPQSAPPSAAPPPPATSPEAVPQQLSVPSTAAPPPPSAPKAASPDGYSAWAPPPSSPPVSQWLQHDDLDMSLDPKEGSDMFPEEEEEEEEGQEQQEESERTEAEVEEPKTAPPPAPAASPPAWPAATGAVKERLSGTKLAEWLRRRVFQLRVPLAMGHAELLEVLQSLDDEKLQPPFEEAKLWLGLDESEAMPPALAQLITDFRDVRSRS
eukprot:TRINITY_DN31714_c5_g1_i1.p1 TRINITY_DN31714_c5_g1~~TRINITY_DN31714_c5_g1_i1.p1  ORF type:complete len:545 (-),score=133.07 TRINITY_DN31714_c5_g1_i1:101-1735(-)